MKVIRRLTLFVLFLLLISISFYQFQLTTNADEQKDFDDSLDHENYVVKEFSKASYIDSKVNNMSIPVLMYHSISDNIPSGVYITPRRFDEHIKALKDAGYHSINPIELARYLNGEGILPDNPILITIDDGYEDNYIYGYNVLKKYNYKATIFLIGSKIFETTNATTDGSIPKMSWKQIKEMKDLVTFQNHTYNSHVKTEDELGNSVGLIATPVRVNGLLETDDQYYQRIITDFEQNEELLQHHLGYSSIVFSYPYGEHSEITINALKSLNIPFAVTVKNGVVRKGDSPYELNRISVNGTWSANKLLEEISNARRK